MSRPSWNPEKDRENRIRHGVGFEEALEAVLDPLSRTSPDPVHSDAESRFIVIGESVRGRLLFVVTTVDAMGKIRIISARRATKRERHAYETS